MRNLNIEPMCEVTSVFWFHERILAVGWNKHVTEFSDTAENELGNGKCWDICHTEDILATAARSPQTLATSSYAGELVFWTLETGQPYRRFDVENPKARIKIAYDGQKVKLAKTSKFDKSKSRSMSYMRRIYRSKSEPSIAAPGADPEMPAIYNRVKCVVGAAFFSYRLFTRRLAGWRAANRPNATGSCPSCSCRRPHR